MVGTFQKTQEELNLYHKKELENALKLATIGEMSARLAHEIRKSFDRNKKCDRDYC